MNDLNRTQLILLVLLVSFFTSLVTGIVTATLVTQAPSPITQTVSRVIEKVISLPPSQPSEPKQDSKPTTIIVTQEDMIIKMVEDSSSAVVSVVATKDLPVIEQYFVNPFENDEFFKNFFPSDVFPQFEIPQYRQKGTEKTKVSSGTGFFVSEDGFLLTNRHVVADKEAEYSIVMNDGRKYPAQVLARDTFQDIAILKIDSSEEKFNFISLGDSDGIKIGQTVVAIGNTLGEFQNTVSVGIVSGLNRNIEASDSQGNKEQLNGFIQTDAAVNPGNSGGPLFNLKGQVVGINTAIAQGAENVGFALPVNFAKKGLADVKEFGDIKYAYLGVRYRAVDSFDYGIVLVEGDNGEPAIMKGSPAEKAGLQSGDVILDFGGIRIGKENPLNILVGGRRVGEVVMLKVARGEEIMDIPVTLDEMPKTL
ncbi:trypsin-like peptidase domain-containing protein [Patescibacteria group bacterium]|nr:trypsin-like peptidase domain-containing protein [Patescibacteria group bacterium]MBU2633515.1 trypsin-like peptidase domain-containing protein [Patescibacteria group bacterium]